MVARIAAGLLLSALGASAQGFTVGQAVTTTSGLVQGHGAAVLTDVSEYLGIPFAQAPVGNLRFAAPQRFVGNGTISGETYPADCPVAQLQNSGGPVGAPPGNVPAWFLGLDVRGRNKTTSEDCLGLNVWTKPQTGEAKKAVLVWIYGGGFTSGSSNSLAYNGARLASEQDVVVVTINYRLDMYGFATGPGLTESNFGLLDQRMAVEWVRDNIAAFGGDPSRITIFGQSAGGASVDFYAYAWVQDPIVAGMIAQSGGVGLGAGSATGGGAANSTAGWDQVAAAAGCPTTAQAAGLSLACMRSRPFQNISASMAQTRVQFGPTPDGKVIFTDYAARTAAGNFIQKPYLTGGNDNEAGLFNFLAGNSFTPDAIAAQNAMFDCTVASSAAARAANKVPVWRYRYFGDWPNLAITNGGAYHSAEIPVLFNTADLASNMSNTADETTVAQFLGGAWATFAKNPAMGPAPAATWPMYNPASDSNTMLEIALNNSAQTTLTTASSFDGGCAALAGMSGLATAAASTGTAGRVWMAGVMGVVVLGVVRLL